MELELWDWSGYTRNFSRFTALGSWLSPSQASSSVNACVLVRERTEKAGLHFNSTSQQLPLGEKKDFCRAQPPAIPSLFGSSLRKRFGDNKATGCYRPNANRGTPNHILTSLRQNNAWLYATPQISTTSYALIGWGYWLGGRQSRSESLSANTFFSTG